jgi:carbonic anhydrase
MMPTLLPVSSAADILPPYRGTPIGLLLEYHNLARPFDVHREAKLLVAMCMDNRKALHMPDNFAYVLRSGGANLQRLEFKVSFAIAVGGVRALALIGHDDCRMVGLAQRRTAFIRGLVENGGWTPEAATAHFAAYAAAFEIGDAAGFVLGEARRLRRRYPKMLVAPPFSLLRSGRLRQVREE